MVGMCTVHRRRLSISSVPRSRSPFVRGPLTEISVPHLAHFETLLLLAQEATASSSGSRVRLCILVQHRLVGLVVFLLQARLDLLEAVVEATSALGGAGKVFEGDVLES